MIYRAGCPATSTRGGTLCVTTDPAPTKGLNLDVPPVWLLDLPVGDLAESLRRVQEEGGKIIKERQAADGEPVSVVVQDPVGALVALVA